MKLTNIGLVSSFPSGMATAMVVKQAVAKKVFIVFLIISLLIIVQGK